MSKKEPFFNYDWSFVDGFEEAYAIDGLPKDTKKVDLPHYARLMPKHYFSETDYQGLFSYEKTFVFDKNAHSNEKVLLRMEGAMIKSHVYLNGIDLGEKITSYFPTVFDLSEAIKDGENRLLIVVDSREDPNIPPFGFVVDYLTFAGIYRPLSLEYMNKDYIEDVFVSAKADGRIRVKTTLSNPADRASYRVMDGEKTIASFDGNEAKIEGITPWDTDNPKLYRLIAYTEKDEKETFFGFRDAVWKEDGFYLNGKKIKLLGLNRHQNFPYIGASGTSSLQKLDVDILKTKAGINLVRTSHYPQSEDFLAHCDEIGLLVIDEVPGWQHIGKEETWRRNFESMIERMVRKERNHPCLIAYGTRIDESGDDHELYAKAREIAKKEDPYRQILGVRNFKNSELLEDIYAYNDFSGGDIYHGLDNPKTVKGAKGRPYLVSEFGGHMFPTKSFDPIEKRNEHVLRHLRVLNDMYSYDKIAGAIGWCAFDYNTHKEFGSGDHVCYHGVFDINRMPKDASYAYLSQTSKTPFIHVVGSNITGDNAESLMKPVTVLSNCDRLALYSNGEFIADFYPDKKDFPSLPHAPFIIDDWIGASFHEEGFGKRLSKQCVKLLNAIASKGVAHVGLKEYLTYLGIFLSKRLSLADVTDLYYKYVTTWGKEPKKYLLKGYINGKEMITKGFGVNNGVNINVNASSDVLHNDETYDMAMVSIEMTDDYGNRLPYMDEVVSLETSGPIEIVGPSSFPLSGGASSFYVRSKKGSGVGKVLIHIRDEEKEIAFEVK